MKEVLKKLMEKELDNFIYIALTIGLIAVVGAFDLTGPEAVMASGLFGALLIKVKHQS